MPSRGESWLNAELPSTLKRVPTRAQVIALHLSRMLPDGQGIICQGSIGERANMTRRTVARGIVDLQRARLIQITRSAKPAGTFVRLMRITGTSVEQA